MPSNRHQKNRLSCRKRKENNKLFTRQLKGEKKFQPLLEFMERGISHNITQDNKELLSKKRHKKGDVVIDLLDRKNELDWTIKIVHEALKAKAPGDKEPILRPVWLRPPIPADNITDQGKYLTQHKYTKRSIKQISLLEESREKQQHAIIQVNPTIHESPRT